MSEMECRIYHNRDL